MQDDTRLQKKPSFFLLERVRIPNTVIDSCQKQVLSLIIGCVIMFPVFDQANLIH